MNHTALSFLEKAQKEAGKKEALMDEKQSYSYDEVRSYALKVGGGIRKWNQTRKPVVVLSERDIRCVVMFWGVLYSGNFYVPLNYKNNKGIFKDLLENIKPVGILSCERDEEVENICRELGIQYDYFEQMCFYEEDKSLLEQNILDEDPAYMVFTSGSTGLPKGVVKTHRSIVKFVESFTETFSIGQEDVFGNQAEFDYDVAAKDIYLSVCAKAKLAVIPKKCFLMPVKLMQYLEEKNVNTLIWSVAAMRFVVKSECLKKYAENVNIEKVFFSGEVLSQDEIKHWVTYLPNALYVNLYAPSEVTGNCLYYIVDNANVPKRLPLGKAFRNIEVMLINEEKGLVKEGELGEICVRGGFLSSGYYADEEKTKEKYIQNPLHQNYIDLVYRTGDMAKYENGELYFCGRKDYQIKFMGHRIELFEIEHVFSQVTGIEKSCCALIEGELVLFYEGQTDSVEVIKKMREIVPKFKIPKKFVALKEFPKNQRGKTDRQKIIDNYREENSVEG